MEFGYHRLGTEEKEEAGGGWNQSSAEQERGRASGVNKCGGKRKELGGAARHLVKETVVLQKSLEGENVTGHRRRSLP